jgi:hypothetical protein
MRDRQALGREISLRICEVGESSCQQLLERIKQGEAFSPEEVAAHVRRDLATMRHEADWPADLLQAEIHRVNRWLLDGTVPISRLCAALAARARGLRE